MKRVGWERIKLGDVLDVQNGFAFKSECFTDSNEGFPLIRIRDLGSIRTVVRYTGEYKPDFVVQPGDFLIGMDGDFECYKWEGQLGLLNQRVCRLVNFSERVDPDFVFFGLQEELANIHRETSFVTVKHLSSRQIKDIEFLLPPIAEQHRIVDILKRADGIRRLRKEAIQTARELIPALFIDMFGDPATNPKGWPLVPVSGFVKAFQSGKNIKAGGDDESSGAYRVLKVSAVTYGEFRPEESKPLAMGYIAPVGHFVQKGDLLFSRANTEELVGATAYVFETSANLLLPDKLWRFVWSDECRLEPLFIWALFQNETIRKQISKLATGTSGSMKNISQKKLLTMTVPLPPYELQRNFTERFESLRSIGRQQVSSEMHTNHLFQSLLHRAFRGEL